VSAIAHTAVVGVIWHIQSDVGAGFGGFSRIWHSPDYSFNDDPGPGHLFDVLQAPDVRRVRFVSLTGEARAQGLAWWSPMNGIWLAVDGLTPEHRGAIYELWLMAPGRPAVGVGTVRVDSSGSGRLLSLGKWAEGAKDEAVTFFVTEERAPTAGVPSPAVRLRRAATQ
jgi:hypothetical protein